jgi:hypothetical protein
MYLEDLLETSNRYEALCHSGVVDNQVGRNPLSILQKENLVAISREMPGSMVRFSAI